MTMLPNPNEDKDLVDFLRQYRPEVPSPLPDLEERLLQQLQVLPSEIEINSVVKTNRKTQKINSPYHRLAAFLSPSFWFIPSVLATGLVASLVSYRVLTPRQPSAAELADLQSIMESDWYYKLNTNPRGELLHSDTQVDINQSP